MELKFRECSLDDLGELSELARVTFCDAFAPHNSKENMEYYLAHSMTDQHFENQLTSPGSTFFFAYSDNQLIGYLKINIAPSQTDINDRESMELERIYVKSEFQSLGYGKVLLEKVIQMAKEDQLDYLWLGVWEKNHRAIRFYERYGFRIFDKHDFQLGDEMQTDLLMKVELTQD